MTRKTRNTEGHDMVHGPPLRGTVSVSKVAEDNSAALEKFRQALQQLPPPGLGHGLHQQLLGVANLGVRAGLPDKEIFKQVKAAIPKGARVESDEQIWMAIRKARHELQTSPTQPSDTRIHRPVIPVADQSSFNKVVSSSPSVSEADLLGASPLKFGKSGEEQAVALLNALFDRDDMIYVGKRDGVALRPIIEVQKEILTKGVHAPHLCPNPFSGSPGKTKDGKESYRCDDAIAAHRFCIVEFDNRSKEEQLKFWYQMRGMVTALIDSGNKSIHAVIPVHCVDESEWEVIVRKQLYDARFVPMGADVNCANPSRMTRLPGYIRETGVQRLLYLDKVTVAPV